MIRTQSVLAGILTAGLLITLNAATSSGGWALVDDFESHAVGTEPSSANGWVAHDYAGALPNDYIVSSGGNQAVQLLGSGNSGYNIPLGANTIADSTTGTIFFRTRSVSLPPTYTPGQYFQMGAAATDWDWTDGGNWWDHDEVGFYSYWNTVLDGTGVKPHHNEGAAHDVDGATWYNAWLVANHTTDTYDFHISQGNDGAIGDPTSQTVATGMNFQNAVTAAGDLDQFMFFGTDGNEGTGGRLDDIYVDNTGANLTNPLPAPPIAEAYDQTIIGNAWAGAAYSYGLGLHFTPTQDVQATALGFGGWVEGADANGTIAGTSGTATIQLYDFDAADPDNSTLLATATIGPGADSDDTWSLIPNVVWTWYDDLGTPVHLTAGEDYMVALYGTNNIAGQTIQYDNGPAGIEVDPLINHLGSYWNSTDRGVGQAPNNYDNAGIQYAGPTLLITIPEPSTFLLGAFGAFGLVFCGRRRKR